MIKFNRPLNLNGSELVEELNAVNIIVDGMPLLDGNNELWLNIKESDKSLATEIVAKHNGTIVKPEPTIEDKLASVGLSLDELKAALEGN